MKRIFLSLIGVCLAAGAFAQQNGYLGTKVSGSVTPSGASDAAPGLGSFIQMVVALGIVLILLKTVIPKVAGKLNKRLVTNATSTLTIEETANFAAGNLYIVQARHKTLLLCASSTGVTCLSDLTDTNPVPEMPTFQEIVEAAEPLKVEAPAEELVPIKNQKSRIRNQRAAPTAIELALERIERLAP